MRLIALIAPAVVAAALTASNAAGARHRLGWIDETTVGNAIESHGFVYQGRHVAVDTAVCLGLRRFGVRTVDFTDQFHRFKCDADAANGHTYALQVKVTKSTATTFWWLVTAVRRDF